MRPIQHLLWTRKKTRAREQALAEARERQAHEHRLALLRIVGLARILDRPGGRS